MWSNGILNPKTLLGINSIQFLKCLEEQTDGVRKSIFREAFPILQYHYLHIHLEITGIMNFWNDISENTKTLQVSTFSISNCKTQKSLVCSTAIIPRICAWPPLQGFAYLFFWEPTFFLYRETKKHKNLI